MLFNAFIFIGSWHMILSKCSSFCVFTQYTRFVTIKACLHFHNHDVLVFDTFSVKKHFGSFLALQRSIISTGLEHVVDTTLYLWKGQVDMKSNIIWEWSREEKKKDIFDSYRSNLIDKSFAWFLCNLEENMILTVRSLFILYIVHFLLKVF